MLTLHQLLGQKQIVRADNRVLLAHITGFSTAQLISRDDYKLSQVEYAAYLQMFQRVHAGEPVAYVIGVREFYGRQFKVTPATLIPRPETELLVDTLRELGAGAATLLDLGTGSGCIAISCKLEMPGLIVMAVDYSPVALAVARENAAALAAEVSFVISDWYVALPTGQRFSLIVSNPPYIELNDPHLSALSHEPQGALTDFGDGLGCIRQVIGGAIEYLLPQGWLLVEHGYNQGAAVRELFRHAGFSQVATKCDYAGLERFTLGQG